MFAMAVFVLGLPASIYASSGYVEYRFTGEVISNSPGVLPNVSKGDPVICTLVTSSNVQGDSIGKNWITYSIDTWISLQVGNSVTLEPNFVADYGDSHFFVRER